MDEVAQLLNDRVSRKRSSGLLRIKSGYKTGSFRLIELDNQKMTWTYKIDGGDGDQHYFSSPLLLESAEEAWFGGEVLRGDARLFRVKHGQHEGAYVALTSRVLDSTESQLERRNIASVIVHIIKNPTDTFDGSERDAEPIGMSFVERVPCA